MFVQGVAMARASRQTWRTISRTLATTAVCSRQPPRPRQWRHLSSFKPLSKTSQEDLITQYALKPVHHINLGEMLLFASKNEGDRLLLKSARFVAEALPIRLAKRIKRFHDLPFIVGMNPHMQSILKIYQDVFRTMLEFQDISTLEDEQRFCDVLQTGLDQSRNVLPHIAKAAREIHPYMEYQELQEYVTAFINARISRRVLSQQHLALHDHYYEPELNPSPLGVIAPNLNPRQEVEEAFAVAEEAIRATHGVCPGLEIKHCADNFGYIKSHIHYMLLGLLKKACQSVIQHHKRMNPGRPIVEAQLPPIVVTLYDTATTTTFQIDDDGGGVSEEVEAKLFDYTAPLPDEPPGIDFSTFEQSMASTGFGLPMTRVYAEYFGGSLTSDSVEAWNTTMKLKIRNIEKRHIREFYQNITKRLRTPPPEPPSPEHPTPEHPTKDA